MTALVKTFGAHRSRADTRNSRSVMRYAGLGVAAVLIVLTMTVLGAVGRPDAQGYTAWPPMEQPGSTSGGDRNAPPVAFPISPFTGYFWRLSVRAPVLPLARMTGG